MDKRIEWILSSFNYRQDRLETELRHVTETLGETLLDRRLARLAASNELALPADTARFLNWAEGPEGPAARAGLWFNGPVPVHYAEDEVTVLLVNERIAEQPYVFGALHPLSPGARILDVGGSESTVALSLASLGHHVSVVDPRGYRLKHPLLHEFPMPLDRVDGDLQFDAAVALSSVEHFGLGGYDQPQLREPRLDRAALTDIHQLLIRGGLLVLTAPCGPASRQDNFQRIYSLNELREMLAGWQLLDLTTVWQKDLSTWIRGARDQVHGDIGVALITARKP